LRKRLTKGSSEEGRRGSCFLTEIEENADDEVFNPEEVVKNIGSIDNYLKNKETDSEQKEDKQFETTKDEIENIGVIEDDKIEPSKTKLQGFNIDTEQILLTEEEKPCEEQHTPASIVDTILAAARRSASVEQSTQDVVDEATNDEHTESMVVDSGNMVVTEPEEEVAQPTQESKKADVPPELIEAATNIVYTIIEKAKLVVSEGAVQSTSGSEVDKDLTEVQAEEMQRPEQEKDTQMIKHTTIKTDSVEEEAIEITVDNENIEDEGTPDETTEISTPVEDSVSNEEATHEATVAVGDIVETPITIEQEPTEDPTCIEDVSIPPVQSAELVEDSASTDNSTEDANPSPTENSALVEERVEDPISKESKDMKIEDLVIEAETDVIEEINVEPTTDALPEETLITTAVAELVGNSEPAEEDHLEATLPDPIETTESHFKATEFIDDIKKEFNDVFVESELMENSQENVTTSTDKPGNMLDSLPLGELAMATLVIFLALIMFNY